MSKNALAQPRLFLGGKQSAGGIDIQSARGSDGGQNSFVVQLILEPLQGFFVGSLQRGARHGDGSGSD